MVDVNNQEIGPYILSKNTQFEIIAEFIFKFENDQWLLGSVLKLLHYHCLFVAKRRPNINCSYTKMVSK